MTLLIAITFAGLLNTLYLTYHAIRGTVVACIGFPQEWCEKVQRSPQSRTMGIPNPYLGLGMLTAILVLILLHVYGSVPFWSIFGIVAFGFLFSLYFLWVQAKVLKAFCTWCVVSAMVFTGLFLVSLWILVGQ
ncbi:MAG: vitamin K epoxide reductase family protein [Flavobacteriales bacterium]